MSERQVVMEHVPGTDALAGNTFENGVQVCEQAVRHEALIGDGILAHHRVVRTGPVLHTQVADFFGMRGLIWH